MLKIGDFSKLARISIRMLHHYDKIGLLKPENVDSFTGYRYYSETQLPLAGRIAALRNMGFSLAAVSEILENYEEPQALERYLLLKQSELREEAERLDQKMLFLETAIERMRKDEKTMKYDVTLKVLPERYVASVRDIVPSYDQEGILWGILAQETQGLNLQMAEPCYGLAIFYDEGYKESDVDIEIQTAVKGTYDDTEHVKFKAIPPIQIASATYKGGYAKLSEVNAAVANWVRDNEYQFNGDSFCIYHVGPTQVQDPEEMVTEVCFPVKKL